MTSTIIPTTVFISDDGCVFYDADLCKNYEEKVLYIDKRSKFVLDRLNALLKEFNLNEDELICTDLREGTICRRKKDGRLLELDEDIEDFIMFENAGYIKKQLFIETGYDFKFNPIYFSKLSAK